MSLYTMIFCDGVVLMIADKHPCALKLVLFVVCSKCNILLDLFKNKKKHILKHMSYIAWKHGSFLSAECVQYGHADCPKIYFFFFPSIDIRRQQIRRRKLLGGFICLFCYVLGFFSSLLLDHSFHLTCLTDFVP